MLLILAAVCVILIAVVGKILLCLSAILECYGMVYYIKAKVAPVWYGYST